MLTPQQVRNHRFQLGSRGTYRAEEVDAFLEELAAAYEEACTQNEALLKKISLLADKVEEYRRDEDTLRSALLVAQRTADQMVREAQAQAQARLTQAEEQAKAREAEAAARAQTLNQEADARVNALLEDASAKAEQLVGEAQAKADRLVGEAGRHAQENLAQLREATERESLLLEQTRSAVNTFRADLIAMYKEHIELINRLPSLPEEPLQEPVDGSKPDRTEAVPQEQDAASEALPAEPAQEPSAAPVQEEESEPEASEAAPAGEPLEPEAAPAQESHFRTIYSAEDEAQAAEPEAVEDEEAQLTMGEASGFHLNLDALADEEPEPGAIPGGIGKDGVPTFEGFFHKKSEE